MNDLSFAHVAASFYPKKLTQNIVFAAEILHHRLELPLGMPMLDVLAVFVPAVEARTTFCARELRYGSVYSHMLSQRPLVHIRFLADVAEKVPLAVMTSRVHFQQRLCAKTFAAALALDFLGVELCGVFR